MKDEDLILASNAALEVFMDGGYTPEAMPEPPAAPEPEEPAQVVNRDPETGRFVAKEETPEETVEEAEEAEEPVAEPETEGQEEGTEEAETEDTEDFALELDPDHPFFAKYGGDLDKAFKALEDSQSFIGEQSREIGELREQARELAAMREQFQEQMERFQIQQAAASVDWDTLIDEDPQTATMRAVELQLPAAFDRAWSAWAEESPAQAYLFMQRLQAYSDEVEGEADVQTAQETTIQTEVEALKQRIPDLPNYLPTIQQMAQERPVLAQALAQGTSRDRAQALEDLYHLAKSRTIESDTSAATRRVVLRQKQEADKAKADAAVVGASNTGVVETGPSEDEILQQQLRDLTGLSDFVIV